MYDREVVSEKIMLKIYCSSSEMDESRWMSLVFILPI